MTCRELDPAEEWLNKFISSLNLEKKLTQVRSSSNPELLVGNLTRVLRRLSPSEGAQKANEIQKMYLEKLGIPVIIHEECLHGCIALNSTVFPQAIALAATWDRDLLYRVAKAIAKECRARGIRQCLSPVVNLAIDVRNGRTEETFGEDPTLASRIAYVYCKALSEEGIVATPKHYIMNFVGEGGRDSHDIHLSEKFIRETELEVFRACIEAGALSVMSAYNSIDDVPCSTSRYWLTEVLRWELGFNGFVVSDYTALPLVLWLHRAFEKPEQVAKAALEAGLDVELSSTNIYGLPLENALKEGLVEERILDEAVKRVLYAKKIIGLFDQPFVDPSEAEKICGCDEHRKLALEAARKSIVLLKNNGVLPIKNIKRLAVIGSIAEEPRFGGYSGTPKQYTWILDGVKEKALERKVEVVYSRGYVSDLDEDMPIPPKYLKPSEDVAENGLKAEYFKNPNLSGEPALVRVERRWRVCRFDMGLEPPSSDFPKTGWSARWSGILTPPASATYVFKVLVRGGEVKLWINDKLVINVDKDDGIPRTSLVDLEGGKKYIIRIEFSRRGYGYAYLRVGMGIHGNYKEFDEAVEVAKNADVAVVVVGVTEGEQQDRASLRLPKVQEKLINEVLKVNRNVIVVVVAGSPVVGEWIYEVPALLMAWYPGQEGGKALAEILFGEISPSGKLPITWPYIEGQLPLYHFIKRSGRVYDYINAPSTPLFPFGHGLSYAEFRYSNPILEFDENNMVVKIQVDVENIGSIEGEEVVQLYLRSKFAGMNGYLVKLKGFERIHLDVGGKKTVEFVLGADDLAVYDENMKRVVKPGEYEIMIGSSSQDIRVSLGFRIVNEVRSSIDLKVLCSSVREEGVKRIVELVMEFTNNSNVSDLATIVFKFNGEEKEMHRVWIKAGSKRSIKHIVEVPKARGSLLIEVDGKAIALVDIV
ncbi:MAG: glycoside hydrolase family 3 N-terminal domain-containing protein [Ignisphaera sp.]